MGMVKGFRPNGDMGYVHCALTPPLKIQDPFPNIFETSERTSFRTIHNSSLYSLRTGWTLLLGACANRRRAEWAPLSVVCDESYSAWLWPEAAIGCVINQELWMANERLQHWNQNTEQHLVVWNTSMEVRSVLTRFGRGGRATTHISFVEVCCL